MVFGAGNIVAKLNIISAFCARFGQIAPPDGRAVPLQHHSPPASFAAMCAAGVGDDGGGVDGKPSLPAAEMLKDARQRSQATWPTSIEPMQPSKRPVIAFCSSHLCKTSSVVDILT